MITDIEEIKKPAFEQNIIDFVKDLLFGKEYTTLIDVENAAVLLRRKYHINPSKVQINNVYQALFKDNIISNTVKEYFKAKEMRGLSGVIVISVITSPYPEYINENGKTTKQAFSCKHDCFYCPREVDEQGKDINPRSYLSDEPTVARGLQNDFDAVKQFNSRGIQYVMNGHTVDKLEIIVLGGTWTEYPRKYQETFIRDIFWAANTFYDTEKREKKTLTEEHLINENSNCRIIGLTLEMRPDSITEEEVHWLRYLGCTRIQLGVQHTDKHILKKVNRGCTTEQVKNALHLLKDSCFKVDAHFMPDLPDATPEIDEEMFRDVIYGQDLQFDQWKIYPTAVVPWTKIKQWYDKGEYIPYTEKDPELLIKMLMRVKSIVPEWVRLNRVIRDIPNTTRDGTLYIYAGNKVTNLRQVLEQRMKKEGIFCSCIRCREVKKRLSNIENALPIVRKYRSSHGDEYFISYESGSCEKSVYQDGKWYTNGKREPGICYGFIRLRLSSLNNSRFYKNQYFSNLEKSAFIRELHVYGQVNTKKDQNAGITQHHGIGKILMKTAEDIAYNNGYRKIVVISGIGVRNYYRKLGYTEENTYMVKNLYQWNVEIICSMIGILMILLYNYMKNL